MNRRDITFGFLVLLFTLLSVFLLTREVFLTFASDYALAGGFIKFFVLASIGDFVAYRIKKKEWAIPNGMLLKAIIWGVIGMFIVLMFTTFSIGIITLQEGNVLPFEGVEIVTAFFISFFMNIIFAPTMMSFHRITDTMIEQKISFLESVRMIKWDQFYSMVIFKTIPLFWIPAHTITFMLGKEYRIIFAALLGIVLGLLLGILSGGKHDKKKNI